MIIYISNEANEEGAGTRNDPFHVDSTEDLDKVLNGSYTAHPTGVKLVAGDEVVFLGSSAENYGNIRLGNYFIPGVILAADSPKGAKVTSMFGVPWDLWANSESINEGDFRHYSNDLYQATSTGTTNGTSPLDDVGVTWVSVSNRGTNYDLQKPMIVRGMVLEFTAVTQQWMGTMQFESCRIEWDHGSGYLTDTSNSPANAYPFHLLAGTQLILKNTSTYGYYRTLSYFRWWNSVVFIQKSSATTYRIAGVVNYLGQFDLRNTIIATNPGDTSPAQFYDNNCLHVSSANNWRSGNVTNHTAADFIGSDDPQFADVANLDLDFRPNSPCLSKAIPTS